MTAMQEGRAPYASMGSVQKVIEKHRQVGLQNVTLLKLQQIGVTESLAPRTLATLEALGFYDSNGNVTAEFDALRKVPEPDFKPRLAALLREAYAPILEVLDPATASVADVENAFRGFEPTGQVPRMVQLFVQLMAYVGIMADDRRKAATTGPPQGSRAGGGTAAGKKKDGASAAPPSNPVHETRHEPPPPAGNVYAGGFHEMDGNTFILKMASGPEMILTVKMEVMRTSVEDREFIFKIVDQLREFGSKPDEAPGSAETAGQESATTEVSS
jgi:hypothetical protein